MSTSDDEAFRRIIDGYGDVPSVDEVEAEVRREATARVERGDQRVARPSDDPVGERQDVIPPEPAEPARQPTAWDPTPWEDEGEFTPPPIPPAPATTWQRLLAWVGLIVPMLAALVAAFTAWVVPSLLGYALIASVIGSFAYLVRTMPRGPRDPGDDGARV